MGKEVKRGNPNYTNVSILISKEKHAEYKTIAKTYSQTLASFMIEATELHISDIRKRGSSEVTKVNIDYLAGLMKWEFTEVNRKLSLIMEQLNIVDVKKLTK